LAPLRKFKWSATPWIIKLINKNSSTNRKFKTSLSFQTQEFQFLAKETQPLLVKRVLSNSQLESLLLVTMLLYSYQQLIMAIV
jgi:hypothetical protein